MTTPINAIPYPTMADPPHMTNTITPVVNQIDSRLVARFATTAARDAAIPTPTAGQICYVSTPDELYVYRSGWVSMCPRVVFKPVDTDRISNAVLSDDPHLLFTVEANSTYMGNVNLIYHADAAGDLKVAISGPASFTAKAISFVGLLQNATFVDDIRIDGVGDISTGGTPVTVGGIGIQEGLGLRMHLRITTAAAAGTVAVSWAQGTSSSVRTRVEIGSSFELWKVA